MAEHQEVLYSFCVNSFDPPDAFSF